MAVVRRRRLRAPSEDRGVLIDPPLADAADGMARNQALLGKWSRDIAGQDASQVRQAARRFLRDQAVAYTSAYRDIQLETDVTDAAAPLVLTGHQPELFHPGVWFKNFVLHELGARPGAVPIHLLIDNDLCTQASLRVPTGAVNRPEVTTVPMDHGDPLPFEERCVRDVECFSTFAQRVGQAMAPWGHEPLLARMWPWACDSLGSQDTLGARLARARHRIEADLGLQTLELPLSAVCDSEPFVRFVADLIGRSDEWHTTYNRALVEFRQVYRLRSQTHPVPNLRCEDAWQEVPLWVWSEEDPSRRRAMIRSSGSRIELKADDQNYSLGTKADHDSVVERLLDLRRQGLKVRPRAIVTTLFARLFLGDLFLHGIGGAKYDELTDVLIERLYQVEPPVFLTVTATLRLPIEHEHIAPERASQLKQLIRALRFHPERYLSTEQLREDKVSRGVDEKSHWIEQSPPRGARKVRHDAIQAVNRALSIRLEGRIQELRDELKEVMGGMRRQSILESREYSFCLFPRKFLQDALFDCLSRGA